MSGRRLFAASVAVIIALTCTQGVVRAQGVPRGTLEVTPSFSFTHNSFSFRGNDQGSLSQIAWSSQVGYSVTDVIEFSGGPILSRTSISSPGSASESATALALIGGVILNLGGSSRTVPFLRAAFGVQTNSGGGETTVFAPIVEAGVRTLLGSTASLNTAVGYQHLTNALGIEDLSADTIGFSVGVSLLRRPRV